MKLGNLRPAEGSVKKRKRIGRGNASGWGRNAGRGEKGYGSRTGSTTAGLFEGGQMPLHRRLPKRGFHNNFKKVYEIVNIRDLDRVTEEIINNESLVKAGLIKKLDSNVKILGDGDLTKAFVVAVKAISASAKEKIIAAGGKVSE
jgi:large subunit ribosomal protein L15